MSTRTANAYAQRGSSGPSDRRRAPFVRLAERVGVLLPVVGLLWGGAFLALGAEPASAQLSSASVAPHPLWAGAGAAMSIGRADPPSGAQGFATSVPATSVPATSASGVATPAAARAHGAYGAVPVRSGGWHRHPHRRVGVSCWTAVWDPWFPYWPACDPGWFPGVRVHAGWSFSFSFGLGAWWERPVYAYHAVPGWAYPTYVQPIYVHPIHVHPIYVHPVYTYHPAYPVGTVLRRPPRTVYVVSPEPWGVREPVVRRPEGEIHNPTRFGTGGWVTRTASAEPKPTPRPAVPRAAARPATEPAASAAAPIRAPESVRPTTPDRTAVAPRPTTEARPTSPATPSAPMVRVTPERTTAPRATTDRVTSDRATAARPATPERSTGGSTMRPATGAPAARPNTEAAPERSTAAPSSDRGTTMRPATGG